MRKNCLCAVSYTHLLVTSVVAARKNEVDMAVGNAVGSNIFNILMVLGIASAISPVSVSYTHLDVYKRQSEGMV